MRIINALKNIMEKYRSEDNLFVGSDNFKIRIIEF